MGNANRRRIRIHIVATMVIILSWVAYQFSQGPIDTTNSYTAAAVAVAKDVSTDGSRYDAIVDSIIEQEKEDARRAGQSVEQYRASREASARAERVRRQKEADDA